LEESQGISALVTTGFNSFFSAATVEGSGSVWYDDNDFGVITFEFDNRINAFALYITASENVLVQLTGFGLASFTLNANTPKFFGVINPDGFQSVEFAADKDPLVGFDALQFGSVVPEPPAWALLISGLGIIVGAALASARRAAS
jgi:hypothetical protein